MSAANEKSPTELRADYLAAFPGWTQQLITRISGKAARGQRPPRTVLPPVANTVATVLQWPAAVVLGWLAYSAGPVPGVLLTPLLWLLSVNSLRRLQVVSAHHAVHREIVLSRRGNYLIQAVVSALSLVHNWDDYFADHVRGHHSRKVFTTAADPDAAFLLELGFSPDLPAAELTAKLWRCTVSPRFHYLFLRARFVTNFGTAPWHRRLLALLVLGGVAATPWLVPWPVALITVFAPLFPLYHVASLLQFVSEHDWLVTDGPPASAADYAARTRGRFCLVPLPATGSGVGAGRLAGQWLAWAARVLLVVIPSRYGVLVGDLPAHDVHHLYPQDHEWTTVLWRRQRFIDEGDPKGMGQREHASLRSAVTSVLAGLGERRNVVA